MTDDYEPIYSEDLVWRGLEITEQYIPLDDLKLALEREQLAKSVHPPAPRAGELGTHERDCQIHMLRSVIAKAHNRP
jgi:hypothetical protein